MNPSDLIPSTIISTISTFKRWALPAQQSGLVEGKYYRRSGTCGMCAKCCNNIYLVNGEKTIDSVEEFEQLQQSVPEYASFRPMAEDEHGVRFECVHLSPEKTCMIYEDRPNFCRTYPSEKVLLLGGELARGCGYRFEVIKPFQQVLQETATRE